MFIQNIMEFINDGTMSIKTIITIIQIYLWTIFEIYLQNANQWINLITIKIINLNGTAICCIL